MKRPTQHDLEYQARVMATPTLPRMWRVLYDGQHRGLVYSDVANSTAKTIEFLQCIGVSPIVRSKIILDCLDCWKHKPENEI